MVGGFFLHLTGNRLTHKGRGYTTTEKGFGVGGGETTGGRGRDPVGKHDGAVKGV